MSPTSAEGRSRFGRFIIAGIANTAFGFSVYSVAIMSGLPVWGALVIGNAAGICFNFLTTGGFVFRSMSTQRFPRFVAAYLALYVLNFAAISGLEAIHLGPIFAQAILTLPMAIFSYLLMARFVFPTQR